MIGLLFTTREVQRIRRNLPLELPTHCQVQEVGSKRTLSSIKMAICEVDSVVVE